VRLQPADDPPDGDPGPGLKVAGDGKCGEDDREVGFDGVSLVVEHRPGSQVGLGHPEGPFDLEQVVVGRHDGGAVEGRFGDVGT